jgi:predicted metal-binding membrane protein
MMTVLAPGHHGDFGASLVPLTVMWVVMMAVMMAPAVWPWVRAFEQFSRREEGAASRILSTGAFATGYLAAWSIYAVGAALLQATLLTTRVLDRSHALVPGLGPAVLLLAGLFQFAPLKRACLVHCRSPLSFFLGRWRNGPTGGLSLGFAHGLYCVGCCWALMATTLSLGVMNLWWMAALTIVVFVEQAAPRGDLIRTPLGAGLIVAGLLQM